MSRMCKVNTYVEFDDGNEWSAYSFNVGSTDGVSPEAAMGTWMASAGETVKAIGFVHVATMLADAITAPARWAAQGKTLRERLPRTVCKSAVGFDANGTEIE